MPELDSLDTSIFELLSENGRMSNLEVAAHVGVSEKTVRQRIRRLIERDGMRIAATLDRGTTLSRLIVLVQSQNGQRFAVADRLSAMPEVDAVHLTTGAYDLIVVASFASDTAALKFYVSHIEEGPGIKESSSTHIVDTITRRNTGRSDAFEQFDQRAAQAGSVAELLDLACDAAIEVVGADRVHLSADDSWFTGPEKQPWTTTIRWRGLSSRYVEEIVRTGRAEDSTVPNIFKHNQHLFVTDAQVDPLFESITELVASEGYHSWLGLPVHNGETRRGTLCLYWNNVIPYRDGLVLRAQELADTLGKHLTSYGSAPQPGKPADPSHPTRGHAAAPRAVRATRGRGDARQPR
jgi:DNA-binding Lrp family transcriptional regulator